MIHERIFETRWRYLGELQKMGLRYDLFHPDEHGPEYYNFNDSEYDARETYATNVYGPTDLQPAELNSHDVRAGMNMLLASLVAHGKTEVYRIYHLDRGYEDLDGKLTGIGAKVYREKE